MKKYGTAHLICGHIGSGKTTFAKNLEYRLKNCVRLTPDEWLLPLYNKIPEMEEFDNYYYRCCTVGWEIARKILLSGIDVILDFGFWLKKDRNNHREKIYSLGCNMKLYYVVCDIELIKKRLKIRNLKPKYGEIIITEEMFNFFAPNFEPPDYDEDPIIIKGD